MEIFRLASIFALSILLGTALTYAMRNIARQAGWVSFPESHHIHRKGIPRLGGVAVFLTFLFFFFIGAITGINSAWLEQVPVLLPATLLFFVGLVDDLRGVRARVKLSFQIIAGVGFFALRLAILHQAPFTISALSKTLGLMLALIATVIWVVLITNAFNLIDGLDGLAAGATLFSLLALCGLGIVSHNHAMVFAVLVLAGAVLGFLRFNFNPASIFLGDGGSLFLGFMLCGISLMPQHPGGPTVVAIAIPLLVFALPILETSLSVVRRFLGAKPLFMPDKDHIHHRLLKLGLTHRQAVIVLYAACALCSLMSLFLKFPGETMNGLLLAVAGVLCVVGVLSLGYQEFSEVIHLPKRWFYHKKAMANNIAVRKTVLKLQNCHNWSELSTVLDKLLETGEFDSYKLTVLGECPLHRGVEDDEIVDRPLTLKSSEGSSNFFSEPIWSLTFDLPFRGTQPLGKFTITKANTENRVLVDFNLILDDLQPELGAACVRIHARETHRPVLELVTGSPVKIGEHPTDHHGRADREHITTEAAPSVSRR